VLYKSAGNAALIRRALLALGLLVRHCDLDGTPRKSLDAACAKAFPAGEWEAGYATRDVTSLAVLLFKRFLTAPTMDENTLKFALQGFVHIGGSRPAVLTENVVFLQRALSDPRPTLRLQGLRSLNNFLEGEELRNNEGQKVLKQYSSGALARTDTTMSSVSEVLRRATDDCSSLIAQTLVSAVVALVLDPYPLIRHFAVTVCFTFLKQGLTSPTLILPSLVASQFDPA
jgi:hypothetical protein